jgi:hypothetical protein
VDDAAVVARLVAVVAGLFFDVGELEAGVAKQPTTAMS